MFCNLSQVFPQTVMVLPQTSGCQLSEQVTSQPDYVQRGNQWVSYVELCCKKRTTNCFLQTRKAWKDRIIKKYLPNSARLETRWQPFMMRDIKNRWKNVKNCSLHTTCVLADNHYTNYLFPVPASFNASFKNTTANMKVETKHSWQHIFLISH